MPPPTAASPVPALAPPTLAALFEHLPDAVYLIDPDSSHIRWSNRAGWAMLGLAPEAVIEHSVLSLQMDMAGMPAWTEIAAVIRAQPGGYTFVGRHRHAAGHEVPVEVHTTHFTHEGRTYFLSVARDVTRRVAMKADMHSREDQLRFALNEATDGLWDWDVTTNALFFSPQLKRILGYGPDEMLPALDTWVQAVHADDREQVLAVLQAHLSGQRGRYEAEYRLRNRGGHYIWVHDRGRVCARDGEGRATRVVGMVQDITERKHLEQQLHHLATHDALTGLPNRREGMARIEAHVRRSGAGDDTFSVCLLDVDHFKFINDTHGHTVGDTCLRELADVLTHAVRSTTDFVCRWGGEKFVLVLARADPAQAQRIAEKVREAVAQHDMPCGPALTISLGVATYRQDGSTAGELLVRADAALYRAKQAGRNRVEAAG